MEAPPVAHVHHMHHHHGGGTSECSEMEYWDIQMQMCMPLPMEGMTMRMAMAHGNLFGTWITEQGPRGRTAFAAPNMEMLDLGTSVGGWHYLNLELMTTADLWLFPKAGYPELLQVGEANSDGVPFLDAQHPHSSPIMGLTLSDTIRLDQSSRDHLTLFFAPRGSSTDGPVVFMHRPTGMVNPDAPLGHHVGQDVGHISSTVIGASLQLGATRFEASAFNGKEPEPTQVDLPLGAPSSAAFRVTEEFSPALSAMASVAYIAEDPSDTAPVGVENTRLRLSASAYSTLALGYEDLKLDQALIYGGVTRRGGASMLHSFSHEAWLRGFDARANLWSRIELLQRTPEELQVDSGPDQDVGRWIAAFTLGYTQVLFRYDGLQLGLGASGTKDLLPGDLIGAYGGNPWTGKVFLQLSGAGMWAF